MTIWEFGAVIDGWNCANGGEPKPAPMSEDEFDDLLAENAAWIAARSRPH